MAVIVTLSDHATEQSTYVVTISFFDEDGNAVTPDSAVWSLTDEAGAVLNGRNQVEISALDTSLDILLQADDLAVPSDKKDATVLLTVEATYTSTLGTGLPLKSQVRIAVDGLVAI